MLTVQNPDLTNLSQRWLKCAIGPEQDLLFPKKFEHLTVKRFITHFCRPLNYADRNELTEQFKEVSIRVDCVWH